MTKVYCGGAKSVLSRSDSVLAYAKSNVIGPNPLIFSFYKTPLLPTELSGVANRAISLA